MIPDKKNSVLGSPVLVKGKTYMIKEKALVGKTYAIKCPVCGMQIETTPDKAGSVILHCPNKDSVVGFNAKVGKEQTQTDEPIPTKPAIKRGLLKNIGKLEWGGFFSKKSALLHVGTNTIGRADVDEPSEISFHDDYMSRRSITIDVEKDPNRVGYTFKLTVLRASNPVFVGSSSLLVGNSIYLNFGDVIKLGNTVLTFKENTKK